MMAMRRHEINLDESQEAGERRVLGGRLPVREAAEDRTRRRTFKERCDQGLTALKWLKDATTALSSLKSIVASAFGVGIFVYSTSSPVSLLAELFPQISGGKQFMWSDPNSALKAGFDSACARPNLRNAFGLLAVGSGLRLQYGLTPNLQSGGWGVHWASTPTKHFDASEFEAFSVWVRGGSGDESFEIGLKDTQGVEVKIESKDRVAADALKSGVEIVIPLSEFKGVNVRSLNNVSISFNEAHGSGGLCFNNLKFEKPNIDT
ncbi:MAG: hypothetical protein IPP10_11105 [Candidatus Competibacteraceae bacterium]|nr:hypothetical protein [Candidatus Competibacteraceae bacterium]